MFQLNLENTLVSERKITREEEVFSRGDIFNDTSWSLKKCIQRRFSPILQPPWSWNLKVSTDIKRILLSRPPCIKMLGCTHHSISAEIESFCKFLHREPALGKCFLGVNFFFGFENYFKIFFWCKSQWMGSKIKEIWTNREKSKQIERNLSKSRVF